MALTSCTNITALTPNTGPERTLVAVSGDTVLSDVYWDSAPPSPPASWTHIPGAAFGGSLFTVPAGSSPGGHGVQLRTTTTSGNVEQFTVTSPIAMSGPILERVSIHDVAFNGTSVDTALLVQAGNADVGAQVLIDGVPAQTYPFKAIREDLRGIDPGDLVPSFHHLGFIVVVPTRDAGKVIMVQVRNPDNALSETLKYKLPQDAQTLDSDGDDIPDVWEINGYDADGDSVIDVDLPGLGCDPHRPDILVEVDVMAGLDNPPNANVWTALKAAFTNAPIISSWTDNGIHLVVDASGSVPHQATLTFAANGQPDDFFTVKAASFDNPKRGRLYHYAIWGDMQPGGYSGVSDVKIVGSDFGGPGDDLLVSFDDFPAVYQTTRSKAATFMHELGHNLMQRHGGGNHFPYMPNYSSVMSYSWQLRTGYPSTLRVSKPVYAPFYYQVSGAFENTGAIPPFVTSVVPDYSVGMGRTLDEASLNETAGLYNGHAIDWDNNGSATQTSVAVDINQNGTATDILNDHPNWFRLVYSGPRQNGQFQ